jgi:hypothetical protein
MGLVYSAETALTVTNLHSLASAATTAWRSAAIDNSSDAYLDAMVQVALNFANTAPGSDKCAYIYGWSGSDATYPSNITGSEGTVTIPTIATNPTGWRLLHVLPYTTQNETAVSPFFAVGWAFGGYLPRKWGLAIVNFSGAALEASGSSVVWRGISLS